MQPNCSWLGKRGGRALCCKGLDPPAWCIDPTWWKHLQFWAIFCSNQWLTTGPSKAVVCTVLYVGKCV